MFWTAKAFSQEFDVHTFAKHVGEYLGRELNNQTYEDKAKIMQQRLNSVPILPVFEKLQDNPIIRKTDYWTQIPFIPEDLNPPTSVENLYGAYLWKGKEVGLLRDDVKDGYCGDIPLNLVDLSEDSLIDLITPYLEKVENLEIPRNNCKKRIIDSYGASSPGTIAGGAFGNTEILKYGYHYTHLATPLFLELAKLPRSSLTQIELFDLAYKIYGDAWTALGIISLMSSWESQIDRPGASMLASRVKPVIENTYDAPGTTYHFWNYFSRGILFNSSVRDNLLSWGYETVWQGDEEDREADEYGMKAAKIVRNKLNSQPIKCIKVDKIKRCHRDSN